jgi:hypothetical protein
VSSGLSQIGGSEMELLVFLKLSALEKDCSFVNPPDGSLSDIARLLQMIKYKLYLRQSATQKKPTCSNFSKTFHVNSVVYHIFLLFLFYLYAIIFFGIQLIKK